MSGARSLVPAGIFTPYIRRASSRLAVRSSWISGLYSAWINCRHAISFSSGGICNIAWRCSRIALPMRLRAALTPLRHANPASTLCPWRSSNRAKTLSMSTWIASSAAKALTYKSSSLDWTSAHAFDAAVRLLPKSVSKYSSCILLSSSKNSFHTCRRCIRLVSM